MRLSFNIQEDIKTINGRIYPKKVLQRAFRIYAKRLPQLCRMNVQYKESPVIGSLYPPIRRETDGTYSGVLRLDDSPEAQKLKSYAKHHKIFLTPGAIGRIAEDGTVLSMDIVAVGLVDARHNSLTVDSDA